MSLYNDYKHLEGRKYVDGKQDCYGLMINYYQDLYGLTLRNFARPSRFWDDEKFDLIGDMLLEDRWNVMGFSFRTLEVGDALAFGIRSDSPNHLGIYVGNGMILHHLYGRLSKSESLNASWGGKVLICARHKDLKQTSEKIDVLTILPPHVKRTLRINS